MTRILNFFLFIETVYDLLLFWGMKIHVIKRLKVQYYTKNELVYTIFDVILYSGSVELEVVCHFTNVIS